MVRPAQGRDPDRASASRFALYSMLDDGTPNWIGLVLLFVGVGYSCCGTSRTGSVAPRAPARTGRHGARTVPRAPATTACATPRMPHRVGAPMAPAPESPTRSSSRVRRRRRPACVRRARAAPPVGGARVPAQADRRQPCAGRRPRAGDLRAGVAQPEVVPAGGKVFDWLYRIATNCWLPHARKRKEELLGDRDDASPTTTTTTMPHLDESTATTRARATLKLDLERAMARAVGRASGRRSSSATIMTCRTRKPRTCSAARSARSRPTCCAAKQKLKLALAAWDPQEANGESR